MTNSNLASIAVTQENLSHFNKRLKKAIKCSLGIDISLSQASEIFAKTCGKDSIHEIQAILQKPKEANYNLTDFICSEVKNGALNDIIAELKNDELKDTIADINSFLTYPEILFFADSKLELFLNVIKDSLIRSKNILGFIMQKQKENTYFHFYYKEENGSIIKITKEFMIPSVNHSLENIFPNNDEELFRQNDLITMDELANGFFSLATPKFNAIFKQKVEEHFFKDDVTSDQVCIYWNSIINNLVHDKDNNFYLLDKTDNQRDEDYFAEKTGFKKVLNNLQPRFNQFS